MSQFVDMLRNTRIRLVLPRAGELVYSNVADRDVALCYTVTSGYIECEDFDLCIIFTEYLRRVSKVKRLGGVAQVKRLGVSTYRQRIVFSRLLDIIRVTAKFNILIEVTNDFRVTEANFRYTKSCIPRLKLYYKLQPEEVRELGFYGWLTAALIAHIYKVCTAYNSPILIAKNRDLNLTTGLLYRVPFLCGTSSHNRRRASIVLLDAKGYAVHSDTDEFVGSLMEYPLAEDKHIQFFRDKGYRIKSTSGIRYMFGFSEINYKNDLRRGVITEI